MSENMSHMLAVGDESGSVSFLIACRDDLNKEQVDEALLPTDVDIVSSEAKSIPQHPSLLIRSYDNVQMIMSPRVARAMAQWLLTAADWLEACIEGDHG